MMNTKTPMPPTQWVKLRHIRLVCVSASTFERILALGRGKTGDRLKQGVHIRWDLTSDHKRNGTENT